MQISYKLTTSTVHCTVNCLKVKEGCTHKVPLKQTVQYFSEDRLKPYFQVWRFKLKLCIHCLVPQLINPWWWWKGIYVELYNVHTDCLRTSNHGPPPPNDRESITLENLQMYIYITLWKLEPCRRYGWFETNCLTTAEPEYLVPNKWDLTC